jgi:hypothetical protein
MKKYYFLCLSLFIGFSAFAQTKRIAHLSHSGVDWEIDFDLEDNFGVAYQPYIVDSFVFKKNAVINIQINPETNEEIWRDTICNPPNLHDPQRFLDSISNEQNQSLQKILRHAVSGEGAEKIVKKNPRSERSKLLAPSCTAPADTFPMVSEKEGTSQETVMDNSIRMLIAIIFGIIAGIGIVIWRVYRKNF